MYIAFASKSARTDLSHTLYKVIRISRVLAEVDQVLSVVKKLQSNGHGKGNLYLASLLVPVVETTTTFRPQRKIKD